MATSTAYNQEYVRMPVAASTSLEALQHVLRDSSGNLIATGDTSGAVYVGTMYQDANNANGIAAAISGKVVLPKRNPYHLLATSGATKAWVGTLVCWTGTTNTVAQKGTTTNDVIAGRVVEFISATQIVVDTSDRFDLGAAA